MNEIGISGCMAPGTHIAGDLAAMVSGVHDHVHEDILYGVHPRFPFAVLVRIFSSNSFSPNRSRYADQVFGSPRAYSWHSSMLSSGQTANGGFSAFKRANQTYSVATMWLMSLSERAGGFWATLKEFRTSRLAHAS